MNQDENSLNNRFRCIKTKAIGIYGEGENARLLVESLLGFDIVCLVAADHIGEEKFGLKIKSIEDAIREVDIIIIAASFSATSIVFSRIKDVVPVGIPILNMLGEELTISNVCENDLYWDENYEKLKNRIDLYDAISFDVFDTIIMRDVLEPKDIFRIIADKKKASDFLVIRIDSEKNCRSTISEPKLNDIYSYIVEENRLDAALAEDLMQNEISLEVKHAIPRKRMVEALEYALSTGKTVFLTSDMYLDGGKITGLLKKMGISGDFELIVSCEYGCSKFNGGLYDVLKEKAGKLNVLHIGDDELVDKNKAEERGVDSYLIHSSYRMLTKSRGVYILDTVKTDGDRDYLGTFLSEKFNDPFALYGSHGKLQILSERDIALLLFPITKLFLDFVIANSQNYDRLLFPSRDGYYLFNEYCDYKKKHPELSLPDARYIYSSRMALSRAALKNCKNFDVLIHKLFGNYKKNCKKYIRDLFEYDVPEEFNHPCGELINKWGKEGLLDRLHQFVPEMVDGLSDVSSAYAEYIRDLSEDHYDRIALIDIVSYGTQPYCLSEILCKTVDMISIGATGIPNVFLTEDRVKSIYGNVNEEINGTLVNSSDMSVLHLLLEVLYSSQEGQFLGIDEEGEPLFLAGSEYNSCLLDGVQKELRKLMSDWCENSDVLGRFSPEFSHGMLRFLRSRYSVISDEIKQKFVFSDPYDGGFVTVNLTESL